MADESIVYNVSFRRDRPGIPYTFRCNRLVGSQSGEVGLHSARNLTYEETLEEIIANLNNSANFLEKYG